MIFAHVYLNKINGLMYHYRLSVEAINSFQINDEFIEKFLAKQFIEKLSPKTDISNVSGRNDLKNLGMSDKAIQIMIEGIKEYLPKNLREINNRIAQNHITLLITMFECHMKDIHREILHLNPTLLQNDRQIPLGKLVVSSKDDLLNEEIEREVNKVDRESIEKRCNYFKDKLKIDWDKNKLLSRIKKIMDIRNSILHENSALIITENDVREAEDVCRDVPLICLMQAAKIYPDSFSMGHLK